MRKESEQEITYVDHISKRRITYTSECVFSIYTSYAGRKKVLHRFYSADLLQDALRDFHALDLSKNYRKYLLCNPNRLHISLEEGEVILYSKCYAEKGDALSIRKVSAYKKKPSINLIQTPISLTDKMNELNFSEFPEIPGRWSKQTFVHALIAYYFILSKEGQHDLMKRAHQALMTEKIVSGTRIY